MHNFLLNLVKLTEYLDFAVNVALSNHCIGLSPSTKISFFLTSICTDELFSTPK